MPRKLCFAALLVSSLLTEPSSAQQYLSNTFGTELVNNLASVPATRSTESDHRRELPAEFPQGLVRPAVHETPDRYVGSVQQASHSQASTALPVETENDPTVEEDTQTATELQRNRQTDETPDRNQPFPTWDPDDHSRPTNSRQVPTPKGLGQIATVISSLAVVLGLFFVTAWFMRRTGPGGLALLPSDVFETLGRAQLNSRQQVHLVRCGAKLLLVSVTPDSAETLTEIDDPDEVTRLAGLCKANQAGSASAAFRQVLQQFAGQPAEPGFVGRTDSQTPRVPLSSELENLHG